MRGHALMLAIPAALLAAGGPSAAAEHVAWVVARTAYVHREASGKAPIVGVLHEGDRLSVERCDPGCGERRGWGWLGPRAAVRLSALSFVDPGPPARELASTARYRYGRVRGAGAFVFARPDRASRRLGFHRAGHDLAFRAGGDPGARWLRRPAGGWVARERIRLFSPSTFRGEQAPVLPLAFVIRDADLEPVDPDALPLVARRHDRLPVVAVLADGRVLTPLGAIARRAVRIATARPRPVRVGGDERWVHVDLGEQVLTAYEGDRPVYATLVSTGRHGPKTATPTGVFSVWYKAIHVSMHGEEPEDPYFADEVPFVQYFRKGIALHGTYWHDRFGHRRSHGCVNLSMADAEWLFGWAPPRLPDGWHAILPLAAERPSLWVHVERSAGGTRRASTPRTANGAP